MPISSPRRRGASTTASFRFSLRGLLLFMLLCSVAFAVLFRFLLPGLRAAREAARQSQCGSHLKQIGLALQNYHDVYGCFPSPYVADANGKPMHSWRVAIMPFIDSSTFYSSYDFNKPWNSAGNMALARKWFSSHHPHGAMVVRADGSIKFLDESTTPEQLRTMLTSDADD